MLELLTQEDLLTSQYRACSINKTRHILILLNNISKFIMLSSIIRFIYPKIATIIYNIPII